MNKIMKIKAIVSTSWFDLEEEAEKFLYYITRNNGDVCEETAGIEDVNEAFRVAKSINDLHLDGVTVDVEEIDEWVSISVNILEQETKVRRKK